MDDPSTRVDLMGLAGDEPRFPADAVMPAQFYSARRGAASVEPIRRLMAGILIDAVRCFQRNFTARHPNRLQEFSEAEFWIFEDRGDGPFSFQGVCDWLEIDPDGLRSWIVRWQNDRRAGDRQRMIRRSPVAIARRMQTLGEGMPRQRSKRGLASRENQGQG